MSVYTRVTKLPVILYRMHFQSLLQLVNNSWVMGCNLRDLGGGGGWGGGVGGGVPPLRHWSKMIMKIAYCITA